MNARKGKLVTETLDRTSLLGKLLGRDSTGKGRVVLPHSHPDLPRASSRINDSYCVTKLPVVHHVTTAPGQSQKKDLSPGPVNCQYKEYKLKSVKSVSCVTQLSYVNPVTNVPNVAPNLAVGARLQNFWKTWLGLGAGPKVVQILKEGYTLPFQIRPKLVRFPTVFITMGNLTLVLRDAYLSHLRTGIKQDTLTALRTAPLHLSTLFPDATIKRAEEDIAQFESKGQSTSGHGKGRYHPYECPERKTSHRDSRPDKPAWKTIGKRQYRKGKGRAASFSSRPAKGQQSYK